MCETRELGYFTPVAVERLTEGHCPQCGAALERHSHPTMTMPGLIQPTEPNFGVCSGQPSCGCYRLEAGYVFMVAARCHTKLRAVENGTLREFLIKELAP